MSGFVSGVWSDASSIFGGSTTMFSVALAEKTLLKSAGWVVLSSGDGLTYNSSGDQITHAGSGANGFGNNGAWYRMSKTGLEIIVWYVSSNGWRSKLSRTAGFVGGSPSATVPPTATDENYYHGSASTTENWYGTATTPTVTDWIAGADADPDSIGFWSAAWTTSSTTLPQHAWMLDPVAAAPSEDPAPWVIHTNTNNDSAWTTGTSGGGLAANRSSCFKDVSGTAFDGIQLGIQTRLNTQTQLIPSRVDNNPYNGAYDAVPAFWSRRDTESNPGMKGRSTLVYWPGETATGFTGNTPYGQAPNGTWWVRVLEVLLPWSGYTIPSNDVITLHFWDSPGTVVVSAPDATPPTIENITPAAGSTITKTAVIGFDVLDETAVAQVAVFVSFPDGTTEVVFDGGRFRGLYTRTPNRRTAITGGFHFDVLRLGGWPARPIFEPFLIDTGGNLGVIA